MPKPPVAGVQSLLERFVAQYGRLPTERDPAYLEMLRMTKYRVMEAPDVQPGKCCNCGASKADGRKYIDTGVDIPWYGAVFFCSHCLKEVSRNVGLFDELEAAVHSLDLKVTELQRLIDDGTRLENRITDGFEGVREYFDRLSALGLHPTSDGGPNVEPGSKSVSSERGEGNPVPANPERRTPKSTTGSGSKNLLSLAERLEAGSSD